MSPGASPGVPQSSRTPSFGPASALSSGSTLGLNADGRCPAGPYLDWITACQPPAAQAVAEADLPDTVDPPTFTRFDIGMFTGVQQPTPPSTGPLGAIFGS